MRGLFTAGVLDVLMERGVTFDGVVGVSAGACFGCNYKSGQIGRVIRYNKRFARDPRYCSWKSLLTTGDLFGADFCYRELPLVLDVFDAAAFAANPMEFHVVTTDCATGKAVYKRLDVADEAAFKWIQASASMPLVSRPVTIDGRELLDGGLSDGIPLRYFESLGYEHNLVITTRPHGYRKFPKKRMCLLKPLLRRYPAIYQALKTPPAPPSSSHPRNRSTSHASATTPRACNASTTSAVPPAKNSWLVVRDSYQSRRRRR